MTRKFFPFAWFGALCHLDLQFTRIGQVVGRRTEAAGSDLFNRAAHCITVGKNVGTLGVLAPFPGIGLATKAVHGQTISFHGSTCSIGVGIGIADSNLKSKRRTLHLFACIPRVHVVSCLILLAYCILQMSNTRGIVHVGLATVAPVVLARFRHASQENRVVSMSRPFMEFKGVHRE